MNKLSSDYKKPKRILSFKTTELVASKLSMNPKNNKLQTEEDENNGVALSAEEKMMLNPFSGNLKTELQQMQ